METTLFQNITFRNIDVLAHAGAAIRSDHSDWAICRNIRFENFIDETSNKTIRIEIKKTGYSNNTGYRDERGHYDGLEFINVTSPGGSITLNGHDATHLIDKVLFKNCYIGGNLVDGLEDMSANAFVTNVNFGVFSTIETWRNTHFGLSGDSGDGADNADPDQDGLINFLEYALGSDPLTKDNSKPLQLNLLSSGALEVSFFRVRSELTYKLQVSTDLDIWNDISINQPAAPGTTETVTWSPSSTNRYFVRLQIE